MTEPRGFVGFLRTTSCALCHSKDVRGLRWTMKRSNVRRVFALLTFTAGAVAAYLMYRRGEAPFSIARRTLLNPVGSLASEVQNAVTVEKHA